MNREIILCFECDEQLLKSIGNAIAALGYIYKCIYDQTDIPNAFRPLKSKTNEELISEYTQLKEFYNEIEHDWLMCNE